MDLSKEEQNQIQFELTISPFYINKMQDGMDACEHLSLTDNSYRSSAISNQRYYLQPIKHEQTLELSLDLGLIDENFNQNNRWTSFNPSIVPTTDGYLINVRSANYIIQNGNYIPIDKEGIVRTRNHLLKTDNQFKIQWKKEIVDNLPRNHYPTRIRGMEDCRLFIHDGKLHLTCTNLDNHPYGQPQMSLVKLASLDEHPDTIYVESLQHLQMPNKIQCEKNWLPFVDSNQIKYIYGWSPITILNSNLQMEITTQPKILTDRFRGSAGPILYKDGWLVLVHEVSALGDGRLYTHRFLQLDSRFQLHSLTEPFVFFHSGIEYVCGMCLNHQPDQSKDRIIVTVGISDKDAKIVVIDPETLIMKLVE